MGKYIKLFNNHAEYEAFIGGGEYIEPHVSLCSAEGHVNYNLQPKIRALKFSSPDACTLGIFDSWNEELFNGNAQYSTDAKSWTDWDGTAVPFGNGTDLYVRGNNPTGWSCYDDETSEYYLYTFTMNGSNVSVEGNVMHLLSYEEDMNTIPRGNCFNGLFSGCEALVDASKLELPATTLASNCYYDMFDNCSSLVNAPELPATTLANGCYNEMFWGCTNLVSVPALPATTLAVDCYFYMFYGCTNLTASPELPATTLAEGCYGYMFKGCTSLVNAPELPATTLADWCYCDMFEGCTILTTAPELPSTTLTEYCYRDMFKGCTSLNHIKMLATDISANDCLQGWVSNVSSTGEFECASGMGTVIPSGTSGIPNGWTITEVAS